MCGVVLRDLGTPGQLWTRWVLMAAGNAARESRAVEIRRGDGCAHVEDGEAWLRMRRLGGNRVVIWGHHPDVAVDASFGEDLIDIAPDWAYEEDSAHAHRGIGFLGWFAHGVWSSLPSDVPPPFAVLLAPMRDDATVRTWWHETWPAAAGDQLDQLLASPEGTTLAPVVGAAGAARAGRQIGLGRSWSTRQLSDAATVHLRSQIHLQMKGSLELADRHHPVRPTLLKQWGRVNLTGLPFRHAVAALSGASTPGFVRSAGNRGLTEAAQRSLENVLMELRMAETDESSGAWMFARATSDGRTVTLERAFDTWPPWYVAPGPGPTMSALHAEMSQRAPAWRPGWARLLPSERF
ncbi:MAG: hypothetical protein JWO46_1960 [Nocardioidaceae bacterium]|nr:hypothetical protein [Nocardioidaceae bacterium]